jgi:hypothetical protein
MRIECRCAVWADDAEVLQAVVVADAVDMVEYQGHAVASPDLVLAAQFAHAGLDTFAEQALLQMAPAVGRVLDEDLPQRACLRDAKPALTLRCIRVEMRY